MIVKVKTGLAPRHRYNLRKLRQNVHRQAFTSIFHKRSNLLFYHYALAKLPAPRSPLHSMATEEAGGPQLASSLLAPLTSTDPSHNTEGAPVSNSERTEAELKTPLSLKRKVTDPNLEIITIDPYYDLTLIVGTPKKAQGQKAFRVNRGSMRNVSDIWTKMLAGDWAERNKSEIELPDDDWRALLLVVRMAHLQFNLLPEVLGMRNLAALAVLTDKYNLTEVVQTMLKVKNWLLPYKSTWAKWPAHPNTQDFAMMVLIFGYNADYDYLVNKLAVEVQVDKHNVCLTYGTEEKQVKLRSSLSNRILSRLIALRTWHSLLLTH